MRDRKEFSPICSLREKGRKGKGNGPWSPKKWRSRLRTQYKIIRIHWQGHAYKSKIVPFGLPPSPLKCYMYCKVSARNDTFPKNTRRIAYQKLLEAATHNPSTPGSAVPEAPTATDVMPGTEWPPPGKRSGPALTPGKLGLIRQALTGILAEHQQASFSAMHPAPLTMNPEADNLFLDLLQTGILYRDHYRPPLNFEDDVRVIFLPTGREAEPPGKTRLLQQAFHQAVSDGRVKEPLSARDIFNLAAALAKKPSWDDMAYEERPHLSWRFLRHTLRNIKIACTFLQGKAQSAPPETKPFRSLGENDTADIADAFFSPARTTHASEQGNNNSGKTDKTTRLKQLENNPPGRTAAREPTRSPRQRKESKRKRDTTSQDRELRDRTNKPHRSENLLASTSRAPRTISQQPGEAAHYRHLGLLIGHATTAPASTDTRCKHNDQPEPAHTTNDTTTQLLQTDNHPAAQGPAGATHTAPGTLPQALPSKPRISRARGPNKPKHPTPRGTATTEGGKCGANMGNNVPHTAHFYFETSNTDIGMRPRKGSCREAFEQGWRLARATEFKYAPDIAEAENLRQAFLESPTLSILYSKISKQRLYHLRTTMWTPSNQGTLDSRSATPEP